MRPGAAGLTGVPQWKFSQLMLYASSPMVVLPICRGDTDRLSYWGDCKHEHSADVRSYAEQSVHVASLYDSDT